MTLTTPTFKVVTSFHRKSGIARDTVQNTWHYQGPSAAPTSQDFTNWKDNFVAFLGGVQQFFSPALSSAADGIKIQFYSIPANFTKALGTPVATINTAWPQVFGTSGFPAEVSLCLTLKSFLTGVPEHGADHTRPASSRRNRVYLGPIATTLMFTDPTTKEPTIDGAAAAIFTTSYGTHMGSDMEADSWVPKTFSRKNWTTDSVVQSYVDNAFDTQRRRGQDPTQKFVGTVP